MFCLYDISTLEAWAESSPYCSFSTETVEAIQILGVPHLIAVINLSNRFLMSQNQGSDTTMCLVAARRHEVAEIDPFARKGRK